MALVIPAAVLIGVIKGCDMVMERILCSFDVRQEVVSPSKTLILVVFEYGCGVGSGSNTQVSIMPNGKLFSPDSYPSFFRVSGQHQLRIVWQGERLVSITRPDGVTVYRQDQPQQIRVNYNN